MTDQRTAPLAQAAAGTGPPTAGRIMSDTPGMLAAAQERLDAALNGPVVGPSRHAQVVDLARQRVHEHERPEHLEYSAYTKAATVGQTAHVTADVLGEFEAVVSDFLPDRQGERFAPHAFDGALDRIRKAGTAVPVCSGTARTQWMPS